MNVQLVDSLVQIISSLTTEERINLEQKLNKRTTRTEEISQFNIQDEPFVGMWQDREDMDDSTKWVRQTRQKEWTN